MKAHGKGLGITTNQNFTSIINRYKAEFSDKIPPPRHEFQPLKTWPAVPHPRQAEIDAFKAVPSKFS